MDEVVFFLTVSCDQKPIVTRSQPPHKRGDRDDNEEAKRPGSGFQSCHHRKHEKEAGEHAPSFIGEIHPSVVWSQSATYLVVSAKQSNMQTKLASKKCDCICHSTSAVVVWHSKSRFARDTDCRTVQDITGCHRS